jgi:hypothetical protein
MDSKVFMESTSFLAHGYHDSLLHPNLARQTGETGQFLLDPIDG